MLVAGEASGDLHGATLARALRAAAPGARLYGMGGRRMAAEEAARWGLVNRVVDEGTGLDVALELAATIDAAAPLAIRAVKAVVSATEHLDVESAYDRLRDGSISAYVRMLESEDAHEGPRAFAESRSPVWKGR